MRDYAAESGRDFSVLQANVYNQARHAMSILANLPDGSTTDEGLLDGFTSEHRTLQQGITRNIVQMFEDWVTMDRAWMVDARNEMSWEFASAVKEMDFRFPLI